MISIAPIIIAIVALFSNGKEALIMGFVAMLSGTSGICNIQENLWRVDLKLILQKSKKLSVRKLLLLKFRIRV